MASEFPMAARFRPHGVIGLALALGLAGPAWAKPTAVVINVPGIACTSCARDITMRLRELRGIDAAVVDVDHRLVRARFDDAAVTVAEMLAVIDGLGFTGSIDRPGVTRPPAPIRKKKPERPHPPGGGLPPGGAGANAGGRAARQHWRGPGFPVG
ncbi:MAG: heavy-metal-associated domain-containing protein [Candidatus Sericytochromatia bacterium]|nr:heavy-metal-associated domain-containing protein [Candidatus Sericytochromatia bacterium]